jgi:proline dehydrogenase
MSLMRTAFLKASESAWLREHAPRHRFVRRSVARLLPGESADDALAAAGRLADSGISTLLSQLGENIENHAEAEAVVRQYRDVLDRIHAAGLPSDLSVKLTQLGLDLDPEFCLANFSELASHALSAASPVQRTIHSAASTIWIDMEHSPYVDAALDIHRRARTKFPNVAICVQAYLYRTEKDVESLIAQGATVRLVKGAYDEPSEIAFPKKSDVDENYFRLAQILLGPEARKAGVRAAIATHDGNLIARITKWAATQGLAKDHLEFDMLYGIQRAEQLQLVREGYRCRVLVSYGSYWFPWFMRRLAERPANVLFLARNLWGG